MSGPGGDPALPRFLAITGARIGGAVLVLFGVVIASGNRGGPPALGYALVVAGILLMTLVTRRLARRWRTPPDERG